jgi:hypothetical protein
MATASASHGSWRWTHPLADWRAPLIILHGWVLSRSSSILPDES